MDRTRRGALLAGGLSAVWALEARAQGSAVPATSSPTPTIPSGYRLGAGDKVRVTVFGEDNLSGQFTVSSSGLLSFSLIGDMRADGLTLDQLIETITKRLRDGYVRDPQVSAEVLTYRPFYILGEVNKPGEYPYVAGLTIVKAVATAGGFTYRANTRRVFLRRGAKGKELAVAPSSESIVQPDDVIRVAERWF